MAGWQASVSLVGRKSGRQYAIPTEGRISGDWVIIPLAFGTRADWCRNIRAAADVRPGQRVAVTAAAGGVGHLAVQIAKARGAYVIGTARAARHDFVRALGADQVIDYTEVDPAGAVGDLDVVFDPVSGANAGSWLPAIKPGGMLIPFGAGGDQGLTGAAADCGVRVATVLVEPDGHGLETLAALVGSGQLRVQIDTVLPLAEAAKAHEIGERGHTQGKIVLTV
jgi:NADPH:quinone reductase-like Zn-dependent oxidoreductase